MITKRLFCKERFLQIPVTTLGKSFLRNPTYMCREYYVSVWLVLATNFLLLAKSSACRVYFLYVCLVAVADSLVLAKPLWTSSTCRAYFLCVCLGIVLLWLRITSELTSARSTSRFTVALMANHQPGLQWNVNFSSSKKANLPIIGSSTLHGSWIVFKKVWKMLWIQLMQLHSIHLRSVELIKKLKALFFRRSHLTL